MKAVIYLASAFHPTNTPPDGIGTFTKLAAPIQIDFPDFAKGRRSRAAVKM